MALSVFIAMGLMRYTLRIGRRSRTEGIRWKGIQWEKQQDDDDDPPEE
jgi:hypothetical protein